MYEIAFVTEEASHLEGKELTAYLAHRFQQLAVVADKLSQAGWSTYLTNTGLAISPPDVDVTDDESAVHDELKALGIDEEIGTIAGRTLEDLLETEDEYTLRAWYEAQDRRFPYPEELVCDCCQSDIDQKMADLEETYGRCCLLMPARSDYERGVLHGNLEALNWVMGKIRAADQDSMDLDEDDDQIGMDDLEECLEQDEDEAEAMQQWLR